MSNNGTQSTTKPATSPITTTTTALARSTPIEPQNMTELQDFATTAAQSGFFGMNPQQAMIVAMAGRDLGFSYTQALRAFYVVKGKPSLSADGMVAACLQHRDVCEYFRPVDVTETSATWETKRAGQEPVRFTFTMKDATTAGIVNDMYKKHPKRMLSARAKSYLARDVYPELLMGLYDLDELGEARQPSGSSAPMEYVVAPVDAASAKAFEDEIAAALDAKALATIGKRLVDARISEDDRKRLRGIYAHRKNAIAKVAKDQAAPPTDEPPPVQDAEIVDEREPGTEG